MFSTLRFFFQTLVVCQNLGFYCLEQCECHIPADQDYWLKENEQDGVDDHSRPQSPSFLVGYKLSRVALGTRMVDD